MNAPANITALDQVRAMYRKLSMADQIAIMSDLIEGGHRDLNRSDDFIDALIAVGDGFSASYKELKAAVEDSDTESELTQRERAQASIYRGLDQ